MRKLRSSKIEKNTRKDCAKKEEQQKQFIISAMEKEHRQLKATNKIDQVV